MKKSTLKKPTISNSPEEASITDLEYWTNKAKIGFPFEYYFKKKIPRPYIFEYAPTSIALNKNLVLFALKNHTVNFFNIHEDLKNDKSFILDFIEQSGSYVPYSCFAKQLQEDMDIFYPSFQKDAQAFRSLSNDLKRNREFVLELAGKNGLVLQYLPLLYENDLEILKTAVEQNFDAIVFLPKKQSYAITTEIDFARKNCKS